MVCYVVLWCAIVCYGVFWPLDDSGKFNLALPTCQFSPDDFQADKETFFFEITKFGRGAAIIGESSLYLVWFGLKG